MEILKDVLSAFCKIDGVKQVLLTDSTGNILESSGISDLLKSPEMLILNVISLCSDIPCGYSMDDMIQSQIEFKDLNLICVPVAGNYFLSIVAGSSVNLGRIRLEIKKNKKTIESAVLN